MRPLHSAMLLAGGLLASTALAQPALVCPTAPAGRACDAFHYHAQMWRPDNRQYVEVTGVNRFATQGACETARELQAATNASVVQHFRALKQQYEADRIGPCHCDMTAERSAPNFLDDGQRRAQLRTVEEVRLRVRERLLDRRAGSDTDVIRGLWTEPPATPELGGPRFAPPPEVRPTPSAADLMPVKDVEPVRSAAVAGELPLFDAGAALTGTATAPVAGGEAVVEPLPSRAREPQAPEERVVAEPPMPEAPMESSEQVESTAPEEDLQAAEEVAERFVGYETQRMQSVIRASVAVGDENVKSRIFEACMQRIQLLSNLRLLIESAGMRSSLGIAARDAVQESERLTLVRSLFGDDIDPHWAPRDATDVVIEFDPAIAEDPEAILRDASKDSEDRKQALYLVLSRKPMEERDRRWLNGIVEEFLR